MLQVELDHILPENDAYGRIREIIQHVEDEKEVYVITKEGRPAVAIISADQLVESQDVPESFETKMPSLGLGGFALPSTAQTAPTTPTPIAPLSLPPLPVTEPIQAAVPLPIAEPIQTPLPLPPLAFAEPIQATVPLPQPPIFIDPLPPLNGTEQFSQAPTILPVPPVAALPPLPPQAVPTIPQFPPTLITPNQAPFSFPKEDLDNASPLG